MLIYTVKYVSMILGLLKQLDLIIGKHMAGRLKIGMVDGIELKRHYVVSDYSFLCMINIHVIVIYCVMASAYVCYIHVAVHITMSLLEVLKLDWKVKRKPRITTTLCRGQKRS